MTRIELCLDVILKGTDLFASTATLTLRDKMGLGERLAGLGRLDRYRFIVEAQGDPDATVGALAKIFDRRSTFYNRNKHEFALVARWNGNGCSSGTDIIEMRSRWGRSLGKAAEGTVLVAELAVHDDDDRGKRLGGGVAAELTRSGSAPARVECHETSTVWWLALAAPDESQARRLAESIAITRSRDEGLLANPAYQRVEFGEVQSIATFVVSSG